jgi:hypothetical protein
MVKHLTIPWKRLSRVLADSPTAQPWTTRSACSLSRRKTLRGCIGHGATLAPADGPR